MAGLRLPTAFAFVPTLLLLGVLGQGVAWSQAFGPETIVSSTANGANCLVAGDLDGDGLVDLVGAEYYGARIVWFRQLSPGKYTAAKVIGASLAGAWHVRVADLDGDRDLDVVATGATANSVYFYENLGAGGSWTAHLLTNTSFDAGGLALFDLEGDGDVDILAASDSDSNLSVFENDGGGGFLETEIAIPSAWAVTAFDFDGDGDEDVFVGGYSADNIVMLRNLGGGQLAAPVTMASFVNGPSSLRGRDIDGDGDLDLLVASRNDSQVSWFPNLGAGVLGPEQLITTSLSTPYQADAADIDDDGDLDVFVAASGSGTMAWFEGRGGGLFFPQKTLNNQAAGARYISLADLDGDGDLDVAGSSNSDDTFGVYANILPLNQPFLTSIEGLHSIESGSVLVEGTNLLGTSATVEGVAMAVTSLSETQLLISLPIDEPGGLRDVVLENGFGSHAYPDALVRYPSLELPSTAGLGEVVEATLDNGDEGAYALAVSGAVYPQPAAFASLGWYYGLELNGVWIVDGGVFTPGATSLVLPLPVVSAPSLAGVPLYLQAWTSQTTLGHAGFTATRSIVLE